MRKLKGRTRMSVKVCCPQSSCSVLCSLPRRHELGLEVVENRRKTCTSLIPEVKIPLNWSYEESVLGRLALLPFGKAFLQSV